MLDDDYEFPDDSAIYSDEEEVKQKDNPSLSKMKGPDQQSGFDEFSLEDSLVKETPAKQSILNSNNLASVDSL